MPGFKEEIARLLKTPPKASTMAVVKAAAKPSRSLGENPALATPEAALRAFLNAHKKGDLAAYRRCLPHSMLEAASGSEDGPQKLEPQEFFTKLTVLETKADAAQGVINAKVVYNRKWLEAHNRELTSVQSPDGAPAGISRFKLDVQQGGMQWDDPIAASGEGFAAFAMVKEPDGWKFQLGYMTDTQEKLKNVAEAFPVKPTISAK